MIFSIMKSKAKTISTYNCSRFYYTKTSNRSIIINWNIRFNNCLFPNNNMISNITWRPYKWWIFNFNIRTYNSIRPNRNILSNLSTFWNNCRIMNTSLILFFWRTSLKRLANILLEWNASDPPRKITTFPVLKHKAETSEVTFGLLS